jgi:hypothetical protein
VLEHFADPGAVLAVDETEDVKKGTATVGTQRQVHGHGLADGPPEPPGAAPGCGIWQLWQDTEPQITLWSLHRLAGIGDMALTCREG